MDKFLSTNDFMKNKKSTILGFLAAFISTITGIYIWLPPFNIHSRFTWCFVIYQVIIYCIFKFVGNKIFHKSEQRISGSAGFFIVPSFLFFIMLICSFAGSSMFHATRYASILEVNEEASFTEDLANVEETDSIALMDTESAMMLGDREIGSLSNVVSQYDVSDAYAQINYKNKPIKVSALEYAGFFKWLNNKKSGVPGYVSVDPVSMSADYQECDSMFYIPSAYFGRDANRYIWSHYKDEITSGAHFEMDEQGNPYYVATVYQTTIGLFGGRTVKGAILLNPCNGELAYYDASDIPQWVDIVYGGNLLCDQYNWFGTLKNGFWNSIFGKKGCKQITEYENRSASDSEEASEDNEPSSDYGYVAKGGDIWIYTGVTSVNKDSSNIGFLLANQRTGEARYYSVNGADESSAMAAAEGEVQEKGYQASFPSLINVDGVPTYIMVLKDNSGLVKLYAAVNVSQYNIVATASTQEGCIEKYRSYIGEEDFDGGNDPEDGKQDSSPQSITIADLKFINKKGDTYLYVITTEQEVYCMADAIANGNEEALLLQFGDVITVTIEKGKIRSWSIEGDK